MKSERYYVQRFARQTCNQMVAVPDEIQFSTQVLQGSSNLEFVAGLRSFQNILRNIYAGVQEDPENYGMCCHEIEYTKTKTYEQTKSRKSFDNIPNLFLAFAKVGEITKENGLRIKVEDLKHVHKTSSQKKVFQRFMELGFSFESLPEHCSYAKLDEFTIFYPDQPSVLKVIKAFNCVKYPWNIAAADYRHLLNEKGYHEEYDIYDAQRMLLTGAGKQVLIHVHTKLMKLNFRMKIKYAGYSCAIKYFYQKEAKETVMVQIEDDDDYYVCIRPLNIKKYASKLADLSQHIRDCCIHGAACSRCGYCDKWFAFEYEGKTYEKCQFICANFKLSQFTNEDIDSVDRLLDYELSCKIQK